MRVAVNSSVFTTAEFSILNEVELIDIEVKLSEIEGNGRESEYD